MDSEALRTKLLQGTMNNMDTHLPNLLFQHMNFSNVFFFFNFYFYFILLYNTVLVLPYIDMNPPRVYMCSQTWTPHPPPSP